MNIDPLIRSAETTLIQCMVLKRDEHVLIIVNPPQFRIGEALFRVAESLSRKVKLLSNWVNGYWISVPISCVHLQAFRETEWHCGGTERY